MFYMGNTNILIYSTSHKVNNLIVPPVDLHKILVMVKHDIRNNPRPELPYDLLSEISGSIFLS